ncbi:MAG: protein tyrosine phosphatase [Rhizobiales bacterium 65-9]|nr:protein tyrosine phosphatase [Hyphomicrobiales bacterium]OJY38060.1 MAG: protein tyrosine phosphatase [Rhizobiales bacterium 65-9]
MPSIHVCSLARLPATVLETGASHVATLINASTLVARPDSIAAERHLMLGVSDITAPLDGHILPDAAHVERLLAFIRVWGGDRSRPLVAHCWAGISRSTAAAFIGACLLRPETPEDEWAAQIRERSPTATPNARLVQLADDLLSRNGRMVDAIARIGRGVDAYEGAPFRLDIGPAR